MRIKTNLSITALLCVGALLVPALPAVAETSITNSSLAAASSSQASLSKAMHKGNVKLGAKTYTFTNFTKAGGTAGYAIPTSVTSISGAGVNKTALQMDERSSTRAKKVPTRFGTTNQLSLLVSSGTDLSNFTLQGTSQGHLYNGLRVQRAIGTLVKNVAVKAVPGAKNYPPGETFGINDYRTVGSFYWHIEVDGAKVGAAGFGGNNSSLTTVSDAYLHNNPHSYGITFWQSRNITLNGVRSFDNEGGFNFERDSGYIRINSPEWGNLRNKHAFSFNSDKASAKVSIVDPVLPAGQDKVVIRIAKRYLGVVNKQRRSDIHIYQNGKDVTAKLAKFVS